MPETPKTREVNDDTEVLNLEDDTTEETDGDEDLDETVIPPVDEEAEEEAPAETDKEGETEEDKSTPESSPEEKEPEADKTVKEPAPSKQPKPVEGETPRETALRLEVQRVKKLLRKETVTEIVGAATGTKQPQAVSERMAKLRETYSEDEIRNMEEAIDVLAESKGYVKASQTFQTTVDDLVGTFLESNPEFKPENDPEDVRWNTFERILKEDYNLKGKTKQQLAVIFDKVKRDVESELGEPTIVTKKKTQESEDRKAAAQTQKIKSVSHSGGTKSAPAKKTTSIDPSVRGMFKGFEDEDLE